MIDLKKKKNGKEKERSNDKRGRAMICMFLIFRNRIGHNKKTDRKFYKDSKW